MQKIALGAIVFVNFSGFSREKATRSIFFFKSWGRLFRGTRGLTLGKEVEECFIWTFCSCLAVELDFHAWDVSQLLP